MRQWRVRRDLVILERRVAVTRSRVEKEGADGRQRWSWKRSEGHHHLADSGGTSTRTVQTARHGGLRMMQGCRTETRHVQGAKAPVPIWCVIYGCLASVPCPIRGCISWHTSANNSAACMKLRTKSARGCPALGQLSFRGPPQISLCSTQLTGALRCGKKPWKVRCTIHCSVPSKPCLPGVASFATCPHPIPKS